MARKKEIVTEDYNKIFPTRLRGLMEEQGKTQQDIAHHLSITRQAVSFYADGQSTPNWENIVKIAEFFSVSTDYLLGLTNIPTNNKAIREICEKTGLSEKAVNRLLDYVEFDQSEVPSVHTVGHNFLSFFSEMIIDKDMFFVILQDIQDLFRIQHEGLNEYEQETFESKLEAIDYKKFHAQREIMRFIEKFVEAANYVVE